MNDAKMIAAIKSQILAVMLEIPKNPKPTYWIDGQYISWNDYLCQLRKTIEWCNEKLETVIVDN